MPPEPDDLNPSGHDRLARDLALLYAPPATVPARIDDAIRNRVGAQMVRSRRARTLRWAGAAAVAAACVVLVVGVALLRPTASDPTLTQVVSPARATIVDALKLAHQIQRGAGRDVNRDGRIDQGDVDALASAVVKLDAQQGDGVQ